jgi:hypothetical protein
MGIAEDRAFWMIKAYATSNNFFHANFEDNLAVGYVGSVAKVLYLDLKEVDHVFRVPGYKKAEERCCLSSNGTLVQSYTI